MRPRMVRRRAPRELNTINYRGFYASDFGMFYLVEVEARTGGFMRHLLY